MDTSMGQFLAYHIQIFELKILIKNLHKTGQKLTRERVHIIRSTMMT